MAEEILDPGYWAKRHESAKEQHHAVYKCHLALWRAIEEQHRKVLAKYVGQSTKILDCGCGWGRLLTLLPEHWAGAYMGVDIAPTFLEEAKRLHPGRIFVEANLLHFSLPKCFDLAVLVSIRPMIKRHLGDGAWAAAESNIRSAADRILYLEYDENDEGSLE